MQTSLTGKFTTGTVKHTLLTGFDYARKNGEVINRTGTPNTLDLFNPVYGVTKPSESSLTPFTNHTARTDIYGVYLQDQVGITKDVKLLAGIRYDALTQNNIDLLVAVDDPIDPFASLASGEQKSRGIELDVSGQLASGWKLIASYSNTKGEVTANSDPTQIGNKLYGLPENTFSLWSTYEFQQGGLKGLGFGAGLNYVSERQGDLANTFTAGRSSQG